jgi:virginiamycin A acetyltransferase
VIILNVMKGILVNICVWLYKIFGGGRRRAVARVVFDIVCRLEGGQMYSATVRRLIANDYKVQVDLYSYGEMFVPGACAPSVKIGRYVSMGRGVRIFTQNHPTSWVSTHPFFYEGRFKFVAQDLLEPGVNEIGNDVWIGQNAIILPGCRRIGNGAVIGAGAIVTKSVPDYAIVAGSPARILRYRFDEALRWKLLNTKWWEREPAALAEHRASMTADVSSLAEDDLFWTGK